LLFFGLCGAFPLLWNLLQPLSPFSSVCTLLLHCRYLEEKAKFNSLVAAFVTGGWSGVEKVCGPNQVEEVNPSQVVPS